MASEASDVQMQIIECVDAGLKQLGQSVCQVVYFNMEKNFGLSKEGIPNQPDACSKALRLIFGMGANVIEELIVQKIQEKFKLRLKPKTSLVEAIQVAKNTT